MCYHSQELDLKGLSLREQKNELIFAEPDPDAESSKFKKRGGVLIATDLNRAVSKIRFLSVRNRFSVQKNDKTKKNDVEMGPVQYVETDNEQYEFGDDQDQFENRKNENTITKTETITKTVETPK
uniref:Cadherin domain-containing protein n=1 Tax=Caenorhabditis tropicalis TaxID=1561998 RepID=A0A1I7T464_9PELO